MNERNRGNRGRRPGRRPLMAGAALLLALIVAGAAAFLALSRHAGTRRERAERAKVARAGPRVEVVRVRESPPERRLLLIGETRPYFAVTLYARVSGYMDRLFVDIGDPVKAGQLLAHVESPEQEQAYDSAEADLFNKKRIEKRMRALRRRRLVSQQQEDQAVADARISEANLRTQAVLRGYQDIRAPFDGIISDRYVDPGWLLQNASGSQAASQPIFNLTQTSRLRIFVYVDQVDAPYVQVGDPVEITVPGRTPVRLAGRIGMLAAALDPRTRTRLAEMIVDNSDGRIVAGSFVQVRMSVKMPPFLELPVESLAMRNNEPFVPVITSDGKLRYSKVDLVDNNGIRILVRAGVSPGEAVALNVGDTIAEGSRVQAVELSAGAPPAQQAAGRQGGPAGSPPASAARQPAPGQATPPPLQPAPPPPARELEGKSQSEVRNLLLPYPPGMGSEPAPTPRASAPAGDDTR